MSLRNKGSISPRYKVRVTSGQAGEKSATHVTLSQYGSQKWNSKRFIRFIDKASRPQKRNIYAISEKQTRFYNLFFNTRGAGSEESTQGPTVVMMTSRTQDDARCTKARGDSRCPRFPRVTISNTFNLLLTYSYTHFQHISITKAFNLTTFVSTLSFPSCCHFQPYQCPRFTRSMTRVDIHNISDICAIQPA